MWKRGGFALAMLCSVVLVLSGCTRVRTYIVEKERVDQNLSSGNAGYLMGTPKATDTPVNRKMTRQTYVTEIELGGVPKRVKGVSSKSPSMAMETSQEPSGQEMIEKPMEPPARVSSEGSGAAVSSYTVQNNDNLEKISQKVYGTSRKWKQIFEANKDQLKNPDRIYAGMVLKIPQEGK